MPCLKSLQKIYSEDKLWPPLIGIHGSIGDLLLAISSAERNGDGLIPWKNIPTIPRNMGLVVKEQIEFLRPEKYQPVASMFLYWSDACPIMGSGFWTATGNHMRYTMR